MSESYSREQVDAIVDPWMVIANELAVQAAVLEAQVAELKSENANLVKALEMQNRKVANAYEALLDNGES